MSNQIIIHLEQSYTSNYGDWVKRLSRGSNVTIEMAEDAIQDACVNALVYAESFKAFKG